MDIESIFQKNKKEKEAMQHVTLLLERAIAWRVTEGDFSGKLSNVLLAADSFQTHMERMFVTEERNGYMNIVCRRCPEFTDTVHTLRATHEQLRKALQQLVLRLERASPNEFAIFDVICEKLESFISRLREHNTHENELIVEALFRDTGGQG